MTPNYYLHRISHEWQYSYSLLKEGYLSIGWRCYSEGENGKIIIEKANKSADEFDEYLKSQNDRGRSRWSLFRFLNMKKNDKVLVPMFEKSFAVFEVIDSAKPISELKDMILTDYYGKDSEKIGSKGISRKGGDYYDIGFVVKVKCISLDNIVCNEDYTEVIKGIGKPRTWADAALISRMKIRITTADISDISKSVDEAIKSDRPIDIHELILEENAKHAWEIIQTKLDPNNYEKLVAWYMNKIGANFVEIPSKNEPGKKDKSDADVVAVFETLKTIIYVQVKKHAKGTETSDWALDQINKYIEQKSNARDPENEYIHIPWVITNASSFKDEVIKKVEKSDSYIRLIAGEEFARMICDVGLSDIADLEY